MTARATGTYEAAPGTLGAEADEDKGGSTTRLSGTAATGGPGRPPRPPPVPPLPLPSTPKRNESSTSPSALRVVPSAKTY